MHYPWHTRQWQQLMLARAADRLPHALLLSGVPGTGKSQFADSFVRTILCEQQNNFYCNSCNSCRLMTGSVHPNVLWLKPEKPGSAIKIDQIREANEFSAQSSLKGPLRFVIIDPADSMNISASNALLKTLEEPAEGTIIILISNDSTNLPATILSRCQRISFPKPGKDLALAWLAQQGDIENPELLLRLANGSPLAALRLSQDGNTLKERQQLYQALALADKSDPIKTAASCLDLEILSFMDHMATWILDLLRLQLGQDHAELVNVDYSAQLTDLQQLTELESNTDFLEYLQTQRTSVCTGGNFNKQLLMENILIRWLNCLRGKECS